MTSDTPRGDATTPEWRKDIESKALWKFLDFGIWTGSDSEHYCRLCSRRYPLHADTCHATALIEKATRAIAFALDEAIAAERSEKEALQQNADVWEARAVGNAKELRTLQQTVESLRAALQAIYEADKPVNPSPGWTSDDYVQFVRARARAALAGHETASDQPETSEGDSND